MRRRVVIALGALAGVLVLPAARQAPGQTTAETQVILKVLLPQADARLTVAGQALAGQGVTRRVAARRPQGKDPLTVTAAWKPTNYTKIIRTRRVLPGNRAEVVVDLRRADPGQLDDLVIRYVPTPQEIVEAMLKLGGVGKDDVVYDLGCGDGRLVITAVEKFHARRGVGVDLDPERVKDSRENAAKHGVSDRVEFRQGDVLKINDLSSATVVLLYMGEHANLRLRPVLRKTLKPGARVVSHRFDMGDWKPDRTETVKSRSGRPYDLHLWVIKRPAGGEE